jgi:hypothetical protein
MQLLPIMSWTAFPTTLWLRCIVPALGPAVSADMRLWPWSRLNLVQIDSSKNPACHASYQTNFFHNLPARQQPIEGSKRYASCPAITLLKSCFSSDLTKFNEALIFSLRKAPLPHSVKRQGYLRKDSPVAFSLRGLQASTTNAHEKMSPPRWNSSVRGIVNYSERDPGVRNTPLRRLCHFCVITLLRRSLVCCRILFYWISRFIFLLSKVKPKCVVIVRPRNK